MFLTSQILEVAYFDDRVERYETTDQVTSAIKEMQHYGVIRQQLNKKYVTTSQRNDTFRLLNSTLLDHW